MLKNAAEIARTAKKLGGDGHDGSILEPRYEAHTERRALGLPSLEGRELLVLLECLQSTKELYTR